MEVKNLGVTFQHDLRFEKHIEIIRKQCFKLLGFIKRNTRDFWNVKTIIILYNSLIKSRLQYACTVWSPTKEKHVHAVEVVQNKFIKYVYYKKYYTNPPFEAYQPLREEFQLASLANCRELSMLKLIYKIFNNNIQSAYLLSLIRFHIPRYNTRPRPPLHESKNQISPINKACGLVNKYYRTIEIYDVPLQIFLRQAKSQICQKTSALTVSSK